MQHVDLQSGRWFSLSVVEQMANIGSEIIRAMSWRDKQNLKYAELANIRALELFDLSLNDTRFPTSLKEIARARELWLDFFLGSNQYHQTSEQWRKYIMGFTYASQNK